MTPTKISHKEIGKVHSSFHHHQLFSDSWKIHFPTFFPPWKALELRAEQAKEAQEALQMTLQAEAPPVSPLGGLTGWVDPPHFLRIQKA